MQQHHKIGIVGYGYLGRSLHRALDGSTISVASVYNRSAERLAGLPDSIATTDMERFCKGLSTLDLVVELAHPDISRLMGDRILRQANYMPCSVGALADDALTQQLLQTATRAGTRLLVPHGAVVGMDNLLEARDNWQSVTITFRKPHASIPSAAETGNAETILFEGSIREIAGKFPRSVNAMVACALATVGLDTALGRIIADDRQGNVLRGEFEFIGKDGSRLSIIKEEPAVGVSSTGMVNSIKGSVIRALGVVTGDLKFV